MILELAEWQSVCGLRLEQPEVTALASNTAVELTPDPEASGYWRVRATHHVGVFHHGQVEVRIRPKVSVSRLLELLSSVTEQINWDSDDTRWGTDSGLLPTVAHAFVDHAERVVHRGLLQGYRPVEEALPGIRGRIALGRQISLHAGLPIPIEVDYDDFTTDILENQLIAGAANLLLRQNAVSDDARRRLRRLQFRLVDITLSQPDPAPPAPHWGRQNLRYKHVVALARLILRSSSLENTGKRNTVGTAFLVDMNKVFEDIVGDGIRTALRNSGHVVQLQRNDWLDADQKLQMRPDILISHGEIPIAVADIKYKQPGAKGVSTDDVYQAVAYATRYDLDAVHLIYASTPPVPEIHVGRITIHLHGVEIDVTPGERQTALAELGHAIVATALSGAMPG